MIFVRFSKTLSSIRESAAVAAGSGMVRSASSMSNESPVSISKSQLMKSSSVEGIRKDVSGGEYMWSKFYAKLLSQILCHYYLEKVTRYETWIRLEMTMTFEKCFSRSFFVVSALRDESFYYYFANLMLKPKSQSIKSTYSIL